eukprot:Awhi_evm1s13675
MKAVAYGEENIANNTNADVNSSGEEEKVTTFSQHDVANANFGSPNETNFFGSDFRQGQSEGFTFGFSSTATNSTTSTYSTDWNTLNWESDSSLKKSSNMEDTINSLKDQSIGKSFSMTFTNFKDQDEYNRFLEAFRLNKTIVSVTFQMDLPPLGETALLSTLTQHSILRSLTLSTGIDIDLFETLLETLENLTTLKLIYFSLTGNPAQRISQTLERLGQEKSGSYKLQYLQITNCNLECDDVIPLAKTLETNEFLKFLDLSSNHIKDRGALAFAKMIKKNKTLCYFNLKSNSMDVLGVSKLVSAIDNGRKNQTLTSLILTNFL